MSSCSSCSTVLMPNAKFCHGCGKPASAAAAPAAKPTTPSSPVASTTTSSYRAPSPATKTPLSAAAARQPTFGGQKFASGKTTSSPVSSTPGTTSSPSSGGLSPSRFGAPTRGPAPTTTTATSKATADKAAADKAAADRARQEAEQKAAAERARQEADQKAAAERARREAEQKAAADKAAADKAAVDRARQEADQKAAAARQEAEKAEAARRAHLASQSAPSVVVTPLKPAASQPVISRTGPSRAGPADFRRGGAAGGGLAPPAAKQAKRHSKINMDVSEIQGSLAGLDVEGIQVSHEKPAASLSREAPAPSPAAPASPSSSAAGGAAPARSGGLANRFATMMAEKAAAEQAAERQKIRGRRKGATEFVDKQIRMLISILQGKGGSVLFGDLFRETADEMPALAATLAVAQKRGVVGFEGNMLMQGVHDKVKITLLKDEIEDSAVFVSVYGIAPVREVEAPKIESCHVCNKTVYPTERISASGKTMHKSCFRCCTCQGILKLAQFAYNGGKFYCDTHFKEFFASTGGKYNF